MLRWRRGSQNLADEWVRDRWFGAPESCAVAFLLGLFGPLTLAGRTALVLSPRIFNELTGRCIACPITRRDRDWSFHVPIPEGHEISGVVKVNQLRSVSWEQRGSRFMGQAPAGVLAEVRAKLKPLLSL